MFNPLRQHQSNLLTINNYCETKDILSGSRYMRCSTMILRMASPTKRHGFNNW